MPPFETLRRLWRWLAFLQIPLLIHLVAYTLTPGLGESRSFLLLAAGVILVALVNMGLAIWLTEPHLKKLRLRLQPFHWIYLLIAIAGLGAFGYLIRPHWIYPHMIIMLALVAGLIYWTFFYQPISPLMRRIVFLIGLIVAIGIIAARLYTLEYYPPINITDEPWGLGKAVSVFRTGELSEWLMLGVDNGTETANWIARYFEAMGWWLRLIGKVGIWEARSFSLLAAIIAGIATMRTAYNLYDKQTMYLTGIVLFTTTVLIYNARIRPDAGVTLALALSLWLFSEGVRSSKIFWYGLAGLAVGFSLFSHYNAVFIGPVMTIALYAPRYWARFREGKRLPEIALIWFIIGGMIAAFIVLSIQYFPNTGAFYRYRGARTAVDLSDFAYSLLKHSTNMWHFSHYELGLFGVAVVAAFWRRKAADLSLGLFVVLYFVGLAFFITSDSAWTYYIAPLLAFSSLLIASLVTQSLMSITPQDSPYPLSFAVVVMVLLMVPNLAFSMRTSSSVITSGQPVRIPPPEAAQWILDNAGTDTIVLGDHYFFLWLYDYQYASPLIRNKVWDVEQLQFYRENPEVFFDELGIQIFINDASTFLDVPVYLPEDYLDTRGYEVIYGTGDYQQGVTLYGRDVDLSPR